MRWIEEQVITNVYLIIRNYQGFIEELEKQGILYKETTNNDLSQKEDLSQLDTLNRTLKKIKEIRKILIDIEEYEEQVNIFLEDRVFQAISMLESLQLFSDELYRKKNMVAKEIKSNKESVLNLHAIDEKLTEMGYKQLVQELDALTERLRLILSEAENHIIIEQLKEDKEEANKIVNEIRESKNQKIKIEITEDIEIAKTDSKILLKRAEVYVITILGILFLTSFLSVTHYDGYSISFISINSSQLISYIMIRLFLIGPLILLLIFFNKKYNLALRRYEYYRGKSITISQIEIIRNRIKDEKEKTLFSIASLGKIIIDTSIYSNNKPEAQINKSEAVEMIRNTIPDYDKKSIGAKDLNKITYQLESSVIIDISELDRKKIEEYTKINEEKLIGIIEKNFTKILEDFNEKTNIDITSSNYLEYEVKEPYVIATKEIKDCIGKVESMKINTEKGNFTPTIIFSIVAGEKYMHPKIKATAKVKKGS